MMIKKFKLLLFFIIVSFALQAQKPMLHPLRSNATLIEYHKNKAKQNHVIQANNRTQSTATPTLTLPFFDEFSYAGPFPDSIKWPNSQSIFVNHTKAMAPPTLGVATFDGLNKFGYPYNSTIASNNLNTLTSVASDTMNSAPFRLDSLPALTLPLSPVDSVYLSFYFEGMGYWEKPESGDDIFLDFYSPLDTTWTQVWTQSGYTYAPDSTWHLVMIPILDTSYFHNGFKFRFRNLSGACGDVDHWHIDAVYLNQCRTNKDTMFSSTSSPCYNPFGDVSFVYDLQSPLKNYSQMPFNQYAGAADMKDSIGTCLRSNFSNTVSIGASYRFYDNTGTVINSSPNPSNNLSPYNVSGYCADHAIMHPSLNGFAYPHPLLATDSSFTMKFFMSPSVDAFPNNDTITFHQKFSNYYAYDDGSAEAGFGIDPGGAGNYKTAASFTLNVADTLRAMDIFFEPVIDVDLLKNVPFNIIVWADNAGVPGNVIYTDTMRYIYFPTDSAINGKIKRENSFLRYQFRNAVPLPTGSIFYLGINQIYDSPEITIGFDRNYDFHHSMFYNADGTNWYVFPGDLDPDYQGSLMIHPVFGDSLQTLAINKFKNTATNISLYPNPAADCVFIQSSDVISNVVITDLLGNIVLQQTDDSIKKINTLSLQSGVYLVKALTNKGFTDTQKLIIAK
ncbi:MAG TPA: T9SS type A sorting domain-containing protein [Bacteroidia bacterium]|nr:T9SS type A sorting domain-containing protein [Bacteroidia bacterium]